MWNKSSAFTHALLPCLLLSAFLTGCSSYEPRETILDDEPTKVVPMYAPQTELERRAYQAGVQEVLTDMKGKMRARDRYTWDAPIVQCGVEIPGRAVNGMMVPTHEECVQIAPGRWTEEAPTYLPVLGENN